MAAVPSIGRASLVEAPLRATQARATESLYERHAAKILGYCLHQLGTREEAEDAVQTTFMNAFRALGRGVVPESESAWLFKIAENVCLSRRRSSWRRGRIESPTDFDLIGEIVPGPSGERDELIGIEDALAAMPEQQRRAILLREWQGLSYREVAEELEVSQSAVETLIFRARRSLAHGLEQPALQGKAKRKGLRRALHVVDAGSILAAAKTLLAGSAAVKATAAAVAVTAAAGTAASIKNEGHSPQRAQPVTALAPQAAAVDRVVVPAAAEAARPVAPRARPVAATQPRAAAPETAAAAASPRRPKVRPAAARAAEKPAGRKPPAVTPKPRAAVNAAARRPAVSAPKAEAAQVRAKPARRVEPKASREQRPQKLERSGLPRGDARKPGPAAAAGPERGPRAASAGAKFRR